VFRLQLGLAASLSAVVMLWIVLGLTSPSSPPPRVEPMLVGLALLGAGWIWIAWILQKMGR